MTTLDSTELRSGYKRTEMGVIPNDWDTKRLCDVAVIATGSTPPTADSSNYGGVYLFVGPVDMGTAKHITHTEKRLSAKGFSVSRQFPKDAILFVCIGSTIGKCGIASTELTSNQQINAIFPSAAFHADYLYYAVCAAAPRVRALAGEQAVPMVNKSQFSATNVALPSLAEQHAIAAALSAMDALMDGLDQLITKKRALKQAAVQQLVTGHSRLPGFEGEWDHVPLGELFTFKNGLNKAKEFFGFGTPIVNYMDVFANPAIHCSRLAGHVSLSSQEIKNFDVKRGDIFFTRTSETTDEIGMAAVVLDEPQQTVFSGFVL